MISISTILKLVYVFVFGPSLDVEQAKRKNERSAKVIFFMRQNYEIISSLELVSADPNPNPNPNPNSDPYPN